jgi:hypothetical protein
LFGFRPLGFSIL